MRSVAGDGRRRSLSGPQKACWGEFDIESASTPGDEHGLVTERRLVEHRAKPRALADGADATHHVAGFSLRERGIGHRRFSCPDGGGERLQIELSRHWHDADHERAVGVCEQRLEHALGGHTKRVGSLAAEVSHGGVVLVASRLEVDT